jgi:hypothetical protein
MLETISRQELAMAEAVEALKRRLEAEHNRKYEAAARQIQEAQAAQLDQLRSQLVREHEEELARLRQELTKDNEYKSSQREDQHSESEAAPLDITSSCEKRARLLGELERLEKDKARLQANQRMMRELIADLVRHYSLRNESDAIFVCCPGPDNI